MILYDPGEFRNFILKIRYDVACLWTNSWGMHEVILFSDKQYFDTEFMGRLIDIKKIQINGGLIQYITKPRFKNINGEKYIIKREELRIQDLLYISNKIKKISFNFNQMIFSPYPIMDAPNENFEIEFMNVIIKLKNFDYSVTNLKSIEMIQNRMLKIMPIIKNEFDEI